VVELIAGKTGSNRLFIVSMSSLLGQELVKQKRVQSKAGAGSTSLFIGANYIDFAHSSLPRQEGKVPINELDSKSRLPSNPLIKLLRSIRALLPPRILLAHFGSGA
jgi:hypothetical protein